MLDSNPSSIPVREIERVLVSVIIPALNEEKVIGQCLNSLSQLDFPRESFEVILVDNGSTDSTLEIADSFSAKLNLTRLQKIGVHISALRNLGASHAHGDIFAFLDSDCIASPSWLKRATVLLTQEGIGVVGAHYRIPDQSTWVARAWYGGLELEKQGDLSWVPSGDLLMTRSTFERVGGFDESIGTNEDCELCGRVLASGLRVIGDSKIAVVHLGTPQTLLAFYRKIRWHGTDGLRVFLRDLPRISNPRPLLFAFYTLICLGGAIIGVILAIWQKRFDILAAFLAALFVPSFLMSALNVIRRKQWRQIFPLTLLYLVYGFARGQAILKFARGVDNRTSFHVAKAPPMSDLGPRS